MGDISCLICSTPVATDDWNNHINTEHLKYLPFRCQFSASALYLLKKYQTKTGRPEESDENEEFWGSLTRFLSFACVFRDKQLDFVERNPIGNGCVTSLPNLLESTHIFNLEMASHPVHRKARESSIPNWLGVGFKPPLASTSPNYRGIFDLSITTFTEQFGPNWPSEFLPNVITLMKNQVDNVQMQLDCQQRIGPFPKLQNQLENVHLAPNQPQNVDLLIKGYRLINHCSIDQLGRLSHSVRRRLVEVLLSGVKKHQRDSLIVEKLCQLVGKVNVDRGEIDLYLGSIDCLLEVICDEKILTSAKRSAWQLVERVSLVVDIDLSQADLIGEKSFVEKLCRSIKDQLNMPDYDDLLEIWWNCLRLIGRKSAANKKRFLDAGGIDLIQQCWKTFPVQTRLLDSMDDLLSDLSNEASIRQDLAVQINSNGNLECLYVKLVLWCRPAKDSVPNWLATELKTPLAELTNDCDRSDDVNNLERLLDIIEVMINQMENVDVMLKCHRLIGQYFGRQTTWRLSLRRNVTEVMLSVVKRHCHNSLIVENFCNFKEFSDTKVVWYQGAVECLLEICCHQNNLTTMAKKSALNLMEKISYSPMESWAQLIGQKSFVEKFCQSIRMQLEDQSYDDGIMELCWECLNNICSKSAGNRKRFVDAGGISLIQQCYEKFGWKMVELKERLERDGSLHKQKK